MRLAYADETQPDTLPSYRWQKENKSEEEEKEGKLSGKCLQREPEYVF